MASPWPLTFSSGERPRALWALLFTKTVVLFVSCHDCELFQDFGDALCQLLHILSDFDPAGVHCMNKPYVGKRGWVFEFNKVTFFITTFAPFYPSNHARYSFGTENCYILFQPELSFAFHDLPEDTGATNWDAPQTVRDRIRVAFSDAGRQYPVPDDVSSPMALDMLRPIDQDGPVYEWWTRGKLISENDWNWTLWAFNQLLDV